MAGIVLFDGYCNFCSGSVQFILKRDRKKHFLFASLQSDTGKQLLKEHGLNEIDSIVLIDDGKPYIKSGAALRISKHLSGLWKLLYIFRLVPKPVRDSIYDVVAKHRYQWFGKKEECMIPTPDVRDRFLE